MTQYDLRVVAAVGRQTTAEFVAVASLDTDGIASAEPAINCHYADRQKTFALAQRALGACVNSQHAPRCQ